MNMSVEVFVFSGYVLQFVVQCVLKYVFGVGIVFYCLRFQVFECEFVFVFLYEFLCCFQGDLVFGKYSVYLQVRYVQYCFESGFFGVILSFFYGFQFFEQYLVQF